MAKDPTDQGGFFSLLYTSGNLGPEEKANDLSEASQVADEQRRWNEDSSSPCTQDSAAPYCLSPSLPAASSLPAPSASLLSWDPHSLPEGVLS